MTPSSSREDLQTLIRRDCVFFGDFTLSSGRKSSYYIDARRATLSAKGVRLIAELFFERFRMEDIDAVGGPVTGADPIVGAVLALSERRGKALRGFLVRPTDKTHGLGKSVEGKLVSGDRAVVLDDVMTGGASLLRAAQLARDGGASVEDAFCVVDRGEDGRALLQANGINVYSIFAVADLLQQR
jgi:orotate phosphoribosyltransferase